MLALGMGVGMQMQILVLTVQNTVDYRHLGTATSGVSLFSAIGASLGVALCGMVFNHRFADELTRILPLGAEVPSLAEIGHPASSLERIYVGAFVAAFDEVFLVAAGIATLAFALSWLLEEVSLRRTAGVGRIASSLRLPRYASARRELEFLADLLTRREKQEVVNKRIAARAGLKLSSEEVDLLLRLGGTSTTTAPPGFPLRSRAARHAM
jgi:hypothetical protein